MVARPAMVARVGARQRSDRAKCKLSRVVQRTGATEADLFDLASREL
jgi:hypothetical protein